jgi:AraC-like DNA-binding protein
MKLPADNYAVLAMVRSLLRNADLTDCTRRTVESVLGVPFPTVRHRLTLMGTTWEAEKARERRRRMELVINAPGKLDPQAAAQIVGFREVNSFYRFFSEQMGMTYTDWRMQRQAA